MMRRVGGRLYSTIFFISFFLFFLSFFLVICWDVFLKCYPMVCLLVCQRYCCILGISIGWFLLIAFNLWHKDRLWKHCSQRSCDAGWTGTQGLELTVFISSLEMSVDQESGEAFYRWDPTLEHSAYILSFYNEIAVHVLLISLLNEKRKVVCQELLSCFW